MPSSSVTAMLIALLGGYALGSISFAVVVSRLFGLQDPRAHGSGNPGATNVLRTGNRWAALFTLLGDGLKGAVAVAIAQQFGVEYGFGEAGAAAVGLAAFTGHLYPVFFGFKGGKGVATFFGVALALDLVFGMSCCAIWTATVLVWRFSSLASVVAALAAPLLWLVVGPGGVGLVFVVVMTALLLGRHRSNIRALLSGTERRIGQRSS